MASFYATCKRYNAHNDRHREGCHFTYIDGGEPFIQGGWQPFYGTEAVERQRALRDLIICTAHVGRPEIWLRSGPMYRRTNDIWQKVWIGEYRPNPHTGRPEWGVFPRRARPTTMRSAWTGI